MGAQTPDLNCEAHVLSFMRKIDERRRGELFPRKIVWRNPCHTLYPIIKAALGTIPASLSVMPKSDLS